MFENDEEVLELTSAPIQPTLEQIVALAKQRGMDTPESLWTFFDAVIKIYKEKRSGCRN